MDKRDYLKLAKVFRQFTRKGGTTFELYDLVMEIADMLEEDNLRFFDREGFLWAIYGPSE